MNNINLENEFLRVEVIPGLGGRIDSIIYIPTNKNWVWKNSELENKAVSKYSNYDDNWQGGWEELFPNDAIEEFEWGKGLDHGELWSAPWNVDFVSDNEVNLSTETLDSGTVFRKIIKIRDNALKVSYKAHIKFNDNFLFKLHLAVPLDSSTEVICDSENVEKVYDDFGNIINKGKDFFNLKKDSGNFDFAYIDLKRNEILVKDSVNNSMKLNFGDENLRYFWIFQTQGGWRNHNALVLEPASNSKKHLVDSIKDNKALKGPLDFNCHYEVEFRNE